MSDLIPYLAATPATAGAMAMAITIFVLAMLLGLEVITKVPTQLHTPLMSGSNAISGITIIGALVAAGAGGWLGGTFGMIAVAAAMVNVVGGYLVTDRMLRMFTSKKKSSR
jgi:H+-translocating NAD(P) transhydrogenase subunit alpha